MRHRYVKVFSGIGIILCAPSYRTNKACDSVACSKRIRYSSKHHTDALSKHVYPRVKIRQILEADVDKAVFPKLLDTWYMICVQTTCCMHNSSGNLSKR